MVAYIGMALMGSKSCVCVVMRIIYQIKLWFK
jgi:hypothetical protein